jgi:outer membrane protein assembly factor BamA
MRRRLLSRVGQPLDSHRIEADVRALMRTRWYSGVEVYYEESPRKSGKLVLTFVAHRKRD